MSITLSDGVVVPDIPDGVITETSPYAFIQQDGDLTYADGVYTFTPTDGAYLLVVASAAAIHADEVNSGIGSGATSLPSQEALTSSYLYTIGDTEWTVANVFYALAPDGYLLWSNHDIYEATADEDGNLVVTTEIYFANSVSKPPFVLPDGTELPALPDGWSDGSPYGMVIDVSAFGMTHAFYAMENPIAAVQDSDGNDIILLPSGVVKGWSEADGAWSLLEEGENTEPGLTPFHTQLVLWSNHDLPYATANDDGTYTIGTEVARKSDVNYRVTEGWMRSIANEARRLGEATGGLTTTATLDIYKSIAASATEVTDG